MIIPNLDGVKAVKCIKGNAHFEVGNNYKVINGIILSKHRSGWTEGDQTSAEFELIMHEAPESKPQSNRHVHADKITKAVNDMSIEWQFRGKEDWYDCQSNKRAGKLPSFDCDLEFREKPIKPVIPWDLIGDELIAWAVDKNGLGYFYTVEPLVTLDRWRGKSGVALDCPLKINTDCIDWKDSLVMRPAEVSNEH